MANATSAVCVEKVSILVGRGTSTEYYPGKSQFHKRGFQTHDLEELFSKFSGEILVCKVFQKNQL